MPAGLRCGRDIVGAFIALAPNILRRVWLGSLPIEKVDSAVALNDGTFDVFFVDGILNPFDVCLEKSGEMSFSIAFCISSVVKPIGFYELALCLNRLSVVLSAMRSLLNSWRVVL